MGWRVLWAVGMVVAVLIATGLLIDLRPEIWKDLLEGRVPERVPEIWKDLLEGRFLTLVALGFSVTAIIVLLAIGGAARSWTGFRGKTVWDFLQLLIVPLVLAVIGLWFATQQDARQQQFENQRSDAERKFADQRAQDEALQAYLDQMSQLLLDRKLLEAEQETPLYTVAQARTSTLILRLDAEHNESVTRFLFNSRLAVGSPREATARLLREITLSHATLSDAYLPYADLSSADLSGAALGDAALSYADLGEANLRNADLGDANLRNADLSVAYLPNADLSYADLYGANLSGANLNGASLNGADLMYANLSDGFGKKVKLRKKVKPRGARIYLDRSVANLSGANLSGANLSGAKLDFANLNGADLSGADLSDAHLFFADLHDADLRKADLRGATALTDEKIAAAESLEGATMPNGQKYEDWQDE
jgi:uncharacterized protein YjbI with pentapeptide repeats